MSPRPDFRRRRALLAWPAAWLIPAAAHAQGAAAALRLGGTGCGMAPLQHVLNSTPGLAFVPNLGTGGGLRALAAGAIDLAVAARPLKDAERAQGLVDRPWLRTAIVWATHASVSTTRSTLREIAALYAGQVERWPDGQAVRAVLRPESDTDTLFVKAISAEMAQALTQAAARPGMNVAVTDDDAVAAIERIPGSLGVTTLGIVQAQNRRLRVLQLDGVVPSSASVESGAYPFHKTLHLVTRQGGRPEAVDLVSQLRARPIAERLAAIGCNALG